MSFELIPNEIIIECFEYLNIFDIFYSFDQLNTRFSNLIRNIRFHINFEDVRWTKFDEFCQEMLSDAQIRQQIYSLRLSNKNTCGQMKRFLSYFSINEFCHLRSLTLIQIEEENLIKLKSLLPSSSKLFSFHLISSKINEDEIISALPMFNLRRLSLLTLRSFLIHIQQPTLITHLTICSCSLDALLHQLFDNVPMLTYLNIEYLSKYNQSIDNTIITKCNAIHLKQLIIGSFKYKFNDFSNLVKQIPNLESLIISTHDDIDMISPYHWEYLIKSSLPKLNIFKFKFKLNCNITRATKGFLKRFSLFQTEFWRKQHHWYTELSSDKHSLCIYTIPYLSKHFQLEFNTKIYKNKLNNHLNIFDNVRNLTLNYEQIKDKCSYRFSNIISLKLINSEKEISRQISFIESLKMIINLSNLKDLDISMCKRIISSGELLQILKESPQLSSMIINPNDLILLFNNKQLSKYLNKIIQKLNIQKHDHLSFSNLHQLKKFCQIFSNVEQLRCNINQPKYILFLLYRLSKLSTINICLPTKDYQQYISFIQKHSNQFNFTYQIKDYLIGVTELSIWIDQNNN